MTLTEKDHQTLLTEETSNRRIHLHHTFLKKLLGAMFRTRPLGDEVLLFCGEKGRMQNAIHMNFVFFPLDIMWLDEAMRIVDFQRAEPFALGIYVPKEPASFVLEAEAGFFAKTGLHIGDRLSVGN